MTRREHVEQLARQHKTKIHAETDPLRVRAQYNFWIGPQIYLNDYSTLAGYATALHELGHVALGHIRVPAWYLTHDSILRDERAAWEWAEREATEPLPREIIEFALWSHEQRDLEPDWVRHQIRDIQARVNESAPPVGGLALAGDASVAPAA